MEMSLVWLDQHAAIDLIDLELIGELVGHNDVLFELHLNSDTLVLFKYGYNRKCAFSMGIKA